MDIGRTTISVNINDDNQSFGYTQVINLGLKIRGDKFIRKGFISNPKVKSKMMVFKLKKRDGILTLFAH